MLSILIIILILLQLGLFVLIASRAFRHDADIFSPSILFTFTIAAFTTPYLIFITLYPQEYSIKITQYLGVKNVLVILPKFICLYTSFYLAVVVGLSKKFEEHKASKIRFRTGSTNQVALFIFIVVGIVSLGTFIATKGSLFYLIVNLTSRGDLLQGNGYLSVATDFISYGAALSFFLYLRQKSRWLLIPFVGLTLTTLLYALAMGSRKDIIFFFIGLILIYHFSYKRIRSIPKVKVATLGFLMSIFFVTLPLFRSGTTWTDLVRLRFQPVIENAGTLVTDLSYAPHYAFITWHFNTSNFWYGASYLDLLTAPIPRSIYPDKPPVDDGVYISNMVARRTHFTPPVSLEKFTPTSWPLETFGAGYANFGIVGIIVLGVMLGLMMRLSYALVISNRRSFICIWLYAYIMFNFHFSNIRIVSLLTLCASFGIVYLLAWIGSEAYRMFSAPNPTGYES